MNILYVILSCQKFIPTKCQWIKKTWVKNLNQNDDYVILSSKEDLLNKTVGYDTGDEYKHAADKYSEFFKNYQPAADIDWLFFVDDDTYVYTSRLKSALNSYSGDEVIGREIWVGPEVASRGIHKDNGRVIFPVNCPSGGSGFAISKKVFYIIKKYVNDDIHCKVHNSDVTFGFWSRENNIPIINRPDLFKSQNPDHPENINVKTPVTWHYCEEKHFIESFLNDL